MENNVTDDAQQVAEELIRKQNKDSAQCTRPCAKHPLLVHLGEQGGKAGTGKAKTRSREHYQRAAAIRWGKQTE